MEQQNNEGNTQGTVTKTVVNEKNKTEQIREINQAGEEQLKADNKAVKELEIQETEEAHTPHSVANATGQPVSHIDRQNRTDAPGHTTQHEG